MGDSADATHHTTPGMTHCHQIHKSINFLPYVDLMIMGQQKRLITYKRKDSFYYTTTKVARTEQRSDRSADAGPLLLLRDVRQGIAKATSTAGWYC